MSEMSTPDGALLAQWRALLAKWRETLLEAPAYADDDLARAVEASGWPGYRPADAEQIAAAEARLGRALPPSYRAFLAVSNGWRMAGVPTVSRLLPVEETEWMAQRHSAWIDAWAAGADQMQSGGTGAAGDGPEHVPPEHLRASLAISDGVDAIFLLNPRVVTPAGEWEALLFDVEAGIDRHPSFWALMQAEYEMVLEMVARAGARLGRGMTAEQAAAGLKGLAAELRRLAEQYQSLARRKGPMAGYEGAIARGLEDALERVLALEEAALTGTEMRGRLGALADELEDAWQAGARSAHFGSFADLLQLRGTAEGCRQAMGVIRFYLEGGGDA